MTEESLQKRRLARHHAEKIEKTAKLGSGKRFKAIEESAKASGASNPAAVAASIGRAKYGPEKMGKMAAAGRKRHAK